MLTGAERLPHALNNYRRTLDTTLRACSGGDVGISDIYTYTEIRYTVLVAEELVDIKRMDMVKADNKEMKRGKMMR